MVINVKFGSRGSVHGTSLRDGGQLEQAGQFDEGLTVRTVGSTGRPASTNSLADFPEADTILVVGANPAQRQRGCSQTGLVVTGY